MLVSQDFIIALDIKLEDAYRLNRCAQSEFSILYEPYKTVLGIISSFFY